MSVLSVFTFSLTNVKALTIFDNGQYNLIDYTIADNIEIYNSTQGESTKVDISGSVGQWDYSNGYTLEGGYVDVYDSSEVWLSGADIEGGINAYDNSSVYITDCDLFRLIPPDPPVYLKGSVNSTIYMSGGRVEQLQSDGFVEITEGSVGSFYSTLQSYVNGVLNMSGGTIYGDGVDDGLRIGGTAYVSGGTIGRMDNYGELYVTGGTFDYLFASRETLISGGEFGFIAALGETIIAGGQFYEIELWDTLIIRGSEFSIDGTPVKDGTFIFDGETDDVEISCILASNESFSQTIQGYENSMIILEAVPEPSTIALLSLGILFIRKRR